MHLLHYIYKNNNLHQCFRLTVEVKLKQIFISLWNQTIIPKIDSILIKAFMLYTLLRIYKFD